MRTSGSIRVRLTLWYVVLLAIILAAFGAGVYLTLRRALYDNLDESFRNQAIVLLGAIQYDGDRPSLATSESSSVPTDEEEQFARIFSVSKELTFDSSAVVGTVPIDQDALDRALAGKVTTRRVNIKEDDDRVRILTSPVIRDGQIIGVLEVGGEEDVTDVLNTLLLIMGVAYPITLAVAVFGGVFIAGRALSPVDKITTLARRITEENLGQRLNLRLPDDEMGRLARTFDEMIGRLDEAFRRQRQFTADTSHELRTPLTIMKGQIDVVLQRQRGPEEYRQVLQTVNDEVDRLIRLAGDLLTLTRADAGEIPLAVESIGVAGVVGGAVEHLRPAAIQKGIELRLVPGDSVMMCVDEGLILQLLLNLLDNAIKYTPDGGQVTASWRLSGESIELSVRDTGIGIPDEHIPLIFNRFYRVDKARSRSEGGVGLGLAISRWIAEAHDGSIHALSVPGEGSTNTVRLPTVR